MGHARNAVIVQTADVMIAIDGGFGTLSEIALALKVGKCVIAIQSRFSLAGVYLAQNAREAVERALASCRAV
jgi:uncharacterized protein (TIGR00725 family)